MKTDMKVIKIEKADDETYIESRIEFYMSMGYEIKTANENFIIMLRMGDE